MEFEDEWEDEYEQELIQERDEETEEIYDEDDAQNVQAFTGTKKDLEEGEKLEVFNEAYQMFHKVSSEWPCLSIDFIANGLAPFQFQFRDYRTPEKFKYPLDLYLVGGSQADHNN